MKFNEAREKLKKIAAGRCHSLDYDVITYTSGESKQKCGLYIAPRMLVYSESWESAFAKLDELLGVQGDLIDEDVEEFEPTNKGEEK